MKYSLNPIKQRRWQQLIVVVIITVIIGVITTVFIARQVYQANLMPLDSTSQKIIAVTIKLGSSSEDIAKLLKDKGIIKSDWAFTQYVRNRQASNDLKAGTFELSPSQSVQEIVSIITGGKISASLITILPGQRLDQLKRTFINSGFSATEVDEAFNPNSYSGHPALVDKPSKASLEGYLYPESFQKTGTAKEIIRQSLDEMQKRLTPEVRNAIAAQRLSIHQGIILASIVEKEADKYQDRTRIAQVFLSRLRSSTALESDATAIYGAALAGKPLSIHYESAYNTYSHKGLTPGPISNVTESSLKAVANPAQTDFLYFVAGDDGTVYFSRTKAEHEEQVNLYCQKRC